MNTAQKTKRVKGFVVVWTEEARVEYDIPKDEHGIVPMDYDEIKFDARLSKRGRPRMRTAVVNPFFDSEEEAKAYGDGNRDWKVVPCTITYPSK